MKKLWIKKIKNNLYLEKREIEFIREMLSEKLEDVHDLYKYEQIDAHYHDYYSNLICNLDVKLEVLDK